MKKKIKLKRKQNLNNFSLLLVLVLALKYLGRPHSLVPSRAFLHLSHRQPVEEEVDIIK